MMQMPIGGCTIDGLGHAPKNAQQSAQYILARLLIGTASITRGALRVRQTLDYSSLPTVPQTKKGSAAFKEFLQSYKIYGTPTRFVQVTCSDNRKFYREILTEFINFHLHTAGNRHTSAFVFLYRILERMSFSIPLLYAASQNDYVGTFRDLKSLFGGNEEGELSLFRKFLNQGRFIDQIKLQVVNKISFVCASGHGSDYFNLTKLRFSKFVSFDEANHEVELRFLDIPDFLVTIRNRFFHLRTGDSQNNITTLDMPNSDEYFGQINPLIANFLSIVVLQSLAVKYKV